MELSNREVQTVDAERSLDAGVFTSWLRRARYSLRTEKGSTVACGPCRACCCAYYFIHVRPEEKTTLARIDKRLLFPAPGLPKGNRLMGYFEDGRCPMLTDAGCSIYEVRPVTCRMFDCRVFGAVGVLSGEANQADIDRQAARWRFRYPTEGDRLAHAAVKRAAEYIAAHRSAFPQEKAPTGATQIALMALKTYRLFLHGEGAFKADSVPLQALLDAAECFKQPGR